MKKKLCALFLVKLMVFFLSGCVTLMTAISVYDAIVPDGQQYAAVLKANWGIELPSGFVQLYYESEEYPRGEGPRYCVLRYKDSSVLDDFRDWTSEDGKTTYCEQLF